MASIRGRVTATRGTAAQIAGDVEMQGSGGVAVTGSVTVDRQALDAFLAFPQHVGVSVWMAPGGVWERLEGLIGPVEWGEDLDSVASWASFAVSDSRAPHFAASSLTAGGIDVRIYVQARSADGAGSWLVFCGVTEGGRATDAIGPEVSFRCVSRTAMWGRQRGSIASSAHGGRTRGELLSAACAAAGVGTAGMTIPDGATMRRPWEAVSVTMGDLLGRIALVEGWRYRPLPDGTIEILPDGHTAGPARHTFSTENVYSFAEEPPERPVTRWTLTGAKLDARSAAPDEPWVDSTTAPGSAGEPTVTVSVRMLGAAEVYRQVDEVLNGKLVRRTQITSTWVMTSVPSGLGYAQVPTSRLSTRETVVSEWYSAKTSSDAGWGVLCPDGVYRESLTETFRPVTRVMETLTWQYSDPVPQQAQQCYLQSKTTEVWRYYAPLDSDPTYTRAETTWIDASGVTEYRNPIEIYRLVSYELAEYSSSDAATALRIELQSWAVTGQRTRSDPPDPDLTVPVETCTLTNVVTNGAVRISPSQFQQSSSGATGGGTASVQTGPLPRPPSASASSPQYRTEPMQVVIAVGSSGYAARFEASTISDAESKEELKRIGRRWVEEGRDGFGTRYAIAHPGLPSLAVGDPVAITNSTYSLSAAAGFVERISRSLDPASGGYDQTTVVVVPWRYS